MRQVLAVCAAVVAAGGLAACGSSDSGSGSASGSTAKQTSAPAAKVRWTKALGGAVVPGPVLAPGGLVLAGANGGTLSALDAATGAQHWRYDAGSSYGSDLSTSPLVRGDLIAWPGPSNTLYGLDLRGHLKWRQAFDAQPLTPAQGKGDEVYVQDMGGTLHALTITSSGAKQRWSLPTGDGTSYGSAAVGPDGTIYTTVGRTLVAVKDQGSSGKVAWRFPIDQDIEVSPAVMQDGTIVLGTNDAFEYGLTPAGKVRWKVRRDSLSYSTAATTGKGQAAFGDHKGDVITVNEAGKTLSRVHGLGQVWTRPALGTDGSVFFGTHSGYVHGFAADGKETLRLKTGGSVESYPTLAPDGTLYIGSEDGKLYAISTAAKE